MLLLDNREFVEELHRTLRAVERQVLIQMMTFDGDASGLAVAGLMAEVARPGGAAQPQRAVDRPVLHGSCDR